MPLTSDPDDPRLTHGADISPTPQADVYLVLSDEERAKGFVRPLRRSYVHWYMLDGSKVPTVVPSPAPAMLAGCGALTRMGLALCETYARDPKFYGSTYCVGCQMHRPVAEFYWDEDGETVGS